MAAFLKKDDNLFAESTMSFGDHLEELRVCLWRCVIWLFAGFAVGLVFGGAVVDYLQTPLTAALEKYYADESTRMLQREIDYLRAQGYPDWIVSIPIETNMIPEEFYVFPGQLERLLAHNVLVPDPRGNPFNEVDNLNALRRPGSAGAAGGLPVIQYTANPQLLLMFRKVENDPRLRTQALNMHEPFMIYLKASLLLGFIFASPGIMYNVWSFVAVGLYAKERRYVYTFMPVSIGLFLAGTLLAFYLVFAFVLDFLLMFNAWLNIDPAPRINEWLTFAILLPFAFGVSFQLPLVMFILERIGIFSVETYLSKWKISVLLIFFGTMCVTPADPWSLILMAVPLTGLYFAGIGMCRLFPKPKDFA